MKVYRVVVRRFSFPREALTWNHTSLNNLQSYSELQRAFKWRIPEKFNLGTICCDDHVISGYGDKIAIIDANKDREISFHELKSETNKLANSLQQFGTQPGDRVAVYLPQSVETAISHIATFKLGAVSVPLFTLFGPDALDFRLRDCGAHTIITDLSGLQNLSQLNIPSLKLVICVSNDSIPDKIGDCPVRRYDELLKNSDDQFTPMEDSPEKESLIIYTSGTTGNPKGALHASRVLYGHLPGIELPHNLFPRKTDVFWTPADWAWIGGLLDALLPCLYYGVPIVSFRARKFDPVEAMFILKKYNVTSSFMPPTALKMFRQEYTTFQHKMDSIGSGGETLGETLLEWGQEVFGTTINEFYGQTECNLVLSNCSKIFPPKVGSMGKEVLGKTMKILDDSGKEVEEGNICVHRSDPACMLRYWNNPKATEKKFIGEYLITGDQGYVDEDGYFFFKGRDDDIICTSGYRVGPGEIEECALKHPAVHMAAAIGKPDKTRGEIVKLICILNSGFDGNETLKTELQNFVKNHLAKHEYPREVEFIDSLPMTTTGKIQRKILKQREVDAAS